LMICQNMFSQKKFWKGRKCLTGMVHQVDWVNKSDRKVLRVCAARSDFFCICNYWW